MPRVVPGGPRLGTLPVRFAVLEFTDEFFPVGKRFGALPVKLVLLEFTDVFAPIGPPAA